jgi:hypothetical protein
LSYNPETPPEVWEVEFKRRFGAAAGPLVARALHRASRILPRIVAYNYPYRLFPTTRGWVEKQRMGDLPEYAAALPSDTQQFQSFADAARDRLLGQLSCKIHPLASSAWFARLSEEVLSLVDQAEAQVGEARDVEFAATMVDLRILAYLALYHSRRCQAGFSYALYRGSQDLHMLEDALAHEATAIEAWSQLVDAAGDAYANDLPVGLARAGLTGHWRDELAALRQGLETLQEERDALRPARPDGGLQIAHAPLHRARPGQDLVVRATASGGPVRVHYGREGKEYRSLAMESSQPDLYRAVIPGDEVIEGLRYWIEVQDADGRRTTFPEKGPASPLSVTVTNDERPPAVVHAPICAAPAGRPLTVSAQVRDPSGVAWVRLRYRSVTQFQDYRTLEMRPTGRADEYRATVPGKHLDPQWDFMYLIEAMDACGNGTIYPDLEVETPYVVVRLER